MVDDILFTYNKYDGIMYQHLLTYRSKLFLVIILKLNIENMASPPAKKIMGCLRRNNHRRTKEQNQTLALYICPQVWVHES